MKSSLLALCLALGACIGPNSPTSSPCPPVNRGQAVSRCGPQQPDHGTRTEVKPPATPISAQRPHRFRLVLGARHGCALNDDGAVWCWGDDYYDQLGTRRIDYHSLPMAGPTLPPLTELSANDWVTCGKHKTGAVSCWGWGSAEPKRVVGLPPVRKIVTPCVLTANGQAWCWRNRERAKRIVKAQNVDQLFLAKRSYGCVRSKTASLGCWSSLGYPFIGTYAPTKVLQLEPPRAPYDQFLSKALQIAILHSPERRATCTLGPNGSVYRWNGNPLSYQSGSPSPVKGITGATELVAGLAHICASLNDGTVRCFGTNDRGQLGNGANSAQLDSVEVSGVSTAVTISAGWHHTCAALRDGSVKCWGGNHKGQLGNGTTRDQTTATAVPYLNDVVQLTAGKAHTCALRKNGSFACWGWGANGQLASAAPMRRTTAGAPVLVRGIEATVDLAAGVSHTCTLSRSGQVHCWGKPNTPLTGCYPHKTSWQCWGRSGTGNTPTDNCSGHGSPQPIAFHGKVRQLSARGPFLCALLDNNDFVCSSIADPCSESEARQKPVQKVVFNLPKVTAISAPSLQGGHWCALRNDGSAVCWGNNMAGQLGDGTIQRRHGPVEVMGLTGVGQIVTGAHHSCALVKGRVFCWGANAVGQLGSTIASPSPKPVKVPGLDDVVQLAAGDWHTCALRRIGRPVCWGVGDLGRHGQKIPKGARTVPMLDDVIAIVARGSTTCGLDLERRIWCWATWPSTPTKPKQVATLRPGGST